MFSNAIRLKKLNYLSIKMLNLKQYWKCCHIKGLSYVVTIEQENRIKRFWVLKKKEEYEEIKLTALQSYNILKYMIVLARYIPRYICTIICM